MREHGPYTECDVGVIGGGLGGVTAAFAAAEAGATVVLSETTDWLSGQMTSQGVSAIDEMEHRRVRWGVGRLLLSRGLHTSPGLGHRVTAAAFPTSVAGPRCAAGVGD